MVEFQETDRDRVLMELQPKDIKVDDLVEDGENRYLIKGVLGTNPVTLRCIFVTEGGASVTLQNKLYKVYRTPGDKSSPEKTQKAEAEVEAPRGTMSSCRLCHEPTLNGQHVSDLPKEQILAIGRRLRAAWEYFQVVNDCPTAAIEAETKARTPAKADHLFVPKGMFRV